MIVNKAEYSEDKLRRSRVIGRKGLWIARRWFSYKTGFGSNSSGYERTYITAESALEEESKWLEDIK